MRITKDDIVISMDIGSEVYFINGVEKTLDVPPYVKDGRTMVPLRMIAEALGAKVEFDAEMELVFIDMP
ncbi:MAG: copper amine oxidase N-terminal domain-containing protein [Desulfotomaculum sp.]|nr:copper amine oxidase N-terminal domain-containing protein [Desulfotomaculum sp.]